ncbi:hypothetical protein L227DRAFT_611844 [Lentinus tigrinus ALCF2SS1-6]|uniref:Uncharacterized protein n=1 Tax=Lentinus tigrinus ALCF2SS1-6 TaxID=1328759 RepID=A0A5C2S7F4_9APHY|nr:hypothetical protein L227DRAFT_611844 [Lentinus tigrinus ALCF2SS1-6]
MSVCHLLGTVVRTNACLLRYRTLLAANGMVDGLSDQPGKLQMLLEYAAASGSGTFVSTPHSRYDSPIDAGNDDWTVSLSFSSCISYIVTKPTEAVAEIYAAPESPGKRNMRHWKVPLDIFPGESNRAVAVDPMQDLLLVFQRDTSMECDVAVHIRSLHDPWTPHPDAALPVVYAAPSLLILTDISGVQIHGRLVSWVQTSYETGFDSQIEVWDWQGGKMIWHHQFGVEVSFTLLDAAHIVATSNAWKDLRVFRFDPPSDPGVDVLRLNLPPGNLPPGNPRRLQESSIPCPSPNAPFWPDPELRMIVLAYIEAQTSKRAVLLIPYATFKRLLRNRPLLQVLSPLQHRINWRDWEHGALRLSLSAPMVGQPWNVYQYHSYGSRFSLLMSNWSKFPRSSTVVTFDLNPWAEKYARSPRSAVDMPHLKDAWVQDGRRSSARPSMRARPRSRTLSTTAPVRTTKPMEGSP